MSPRPRKNGKDLPKNLYSRKRKGVVYYEYHDPRNDKWIGFGTDKDAAIVDAQGINQEIYNAIRKRRVEEIKEYSDSILFRDWIPKYWDIKIENNNPKPNTLRTNQHITKRLTAVFGDFPLNEISVKSISEFLDSVKSDTPRMAQSFRSVLVDVYKVAISQGECEINPAISTLNPKAEVKRARLSLDEFNTILDATVVLDPWVGNSILLALVTGQRLSDIANMKFKDVNDGWLHVKQQKTGTLLRLDLNIKLESIGFSINDAVNRCRSRNVVSPHLIHHTKRRTLSERGKAVHVNTISKGFLRARRLAGNTDKNGPTFHEIRSLAAREYTKQGLDAQLLLGHKDARMTAVYKDNRGSEWIEVK